MRSWKKFFEIDEQRAADEAQVLKYLEARVPCIIYRNSENGIDSWSVGVDNSDFWLTAFEIHNNNSIEALDQAIRTVRSIPCLTESGDT